VAWWAAGLPVTVGAVITLVPMRVDHLPAVARWLEQPHVAEWWLSDAHAAEQLDEYRRRVDDPGHPTRMLIATYEGQDIGFAQWYRWSDYGDHATTLGALWSEVGIDYAIGEPGMLGQGLGVRLIDAVVREARSHVPGASVVVDPHIGNLPSRTSLERAGFRLVEEKAVRRGTAAHLVAVYRLDD
jgi:aminoglycoside 6'-N-acetyltransferase